MPYMKNGKRDYRREYDKYHGTDQQKKNRATRNAARRAATKAGKVTKGDGKDVAHKKAFDKGGSNKNGTRVESRSKNRSFRRDSKSNLVSERSKRESRKK